MTRPRTHRPPKELLRKHALPKEEAKRRVEECNLGRLISYSHCEFQGEWPTYSFEIAVDSDRFLGDVSNVGKIEEAFREVFPEAEVFLYVGYKGACSPALLARINLITEEEIELYERDE